jgi:hypothetical protein
MHTKRQPGAAHIEERWIGKCALDWLFDRATVASSIQVGFIIAELKTKRLLRVNQ